jgi:predicted nucleic acid-binding protein
MRTDLPDVSTLVALHLPDHEFHQQATAWFDAATAIALSPVTEMGFVRLMLNPVVTGTLGPYPASDIERALSELHADARVSFISDATSLHGVTRPAALRPRHVTDLHLALLAKARGAIFITLDRRLRPALPASLRSSVECLIP